MSTASDAPPSMQPDSQKLTPVEPASGSEHPASGNGHTAEAPLSASSATSDKTDWGGIITSVAVLLAMVVPVVSSAIYNLTGAAERRVNIVTTASNADSVWTLFGNTQVDGEPVRARVSVVASDPQGNRFAAPTVWTDSTGRFKIDPIPARLSRDSTVGPVSEVIVTARARELRDTTQAIAGEEILRLSSHARTRWVQLPPFMLLTAFVVFAMSVAVGLFQITKLGGRRIQYYGSITLAFLLTVSVVTFISLGLRHVNAAGMQGDVVALGFANIYKGTYVKDLSPEWLFSLTAPSQIIPEKTVQSTTSTASPAPIARGFGVPLWALLVAVSGAGLLTMRLIVKQVLKPVDFSKDEDFRPRLQEVVFHQFFLLFSPIGAVFVYQLLVIAGAASVETTVAIVMLAAGLALNPLLDRAVREAEDVVKGTKTT